MVKKNINEFITDKLQLSTYRKLLQLRTTPLSFIRGDFYNLSTCWRLSGQFHAPAALPPAKTPVPTGYSHAPNNDVSFNDGPHMRRWSHKIMI